MEEKTMNSEKKVEFRAAFRGFNKQDVTARIGKIAEDYAHEKEAWELETARLRDALKTETEEKYALAEKYRKLTTEHDVLIVEKKKIEQELLKARSEAKPEKETHKALESVFSALQGELASANAELANYKEAQFKLKRGGDAVNAELTALKNKLAEKNIEVDSLRRALADAEKTSEERYGALSKQSGIIEGYEAQIVLLKNELAAKSGGSALDTEAFFAKLDEKLASLAVKAEEAPIQAEEPAVIKEEPKEVKAEEPKEEEKTAAPEKAYSETDKKIDSFFEGL